MELVCQPKVLMVSAVSVLLRKRITAVSLFLYRTWSHAAIC